MSVQEKLESLRDLDGFKGVAVFTPRGELLADLQSPDSEVDLKGAGALANNVLLNAQKASLEMGAGRGQLIQIDAQKTQFIVRCLNEGSHPLDCAPGKTHIHMVLALDHKTSVGMAERSVNQVIEKLAGDFRPDS